MVFHAKTSTGFASIKSVRDVWQESLQSLIPIAWRFSNTYSGVTLMNAELFLERIVTGDEAWVHDFELEFKGRASSGNTWLVYCGVSVATSLLVERAGIGVGVRLGSVRGRQRGKAYLHRYISLCVYVRVCGCVCACTCAPPLV